MRQFFLQLAMQQMTKTSCRTHVTCCNTSRNIAKSRSLDHFSCNSQWNFSLRNMLWRGGVTFAISSATCLAMPLCCKLQKKIASCNSALSRELVKIYMLTARGALNTILYGEAPPRGPTPYPFIYHFWQKRIPFVYLLKNGTPFTCLVRITASLF